MFSNSYLDEKKACNYFRILLTVCTPWLNLIILLFSDKLPNYVSVFLSSKCWLFLVSIFWFIRVEVVSIFIENHINLNFFLLNIIMKLIPSIRFFMMTKGTLSPEQQSEYRIFLSSDIILIISVLRISLFWF